MELGTEANGSLLLQAAFAENRDRFWRFLNRRCLDQGLAEDLMQALGVKLAAHRPAAPIADPIAYLYRMCENLVRDNARSEQRRLTHETTWSEQTEVAVGDDADYEPVDPITPERVVLDRDLLRRILAELEQLPTPGRSIFLAYRVEGKGQKQIAAEMGISLSSVEKHLQRAYKLVVDVRKRFDAGDG